MKAKGPILTLLAVVVLALVLLAANLSTPAEDPSTTRAGENAPAAPPAVAAPPAPAPPAEAPEAPPAEATPFPAQATFTGRTSGRKAGEASVAVAVKDGKASAYLCDGKKLESWLEGRAEGSSLKLTGKDGSTLNGVYADGRLSGDVTIGGLTWTYDATPSARPAGLYRARKATKDAGWIVYPDGSQTGVQNLDGNATEAPPLDPAAGNAVLGGDAVPVTTIEGGDASSVGR